MKDISTKVVTAARRRIGRPFRHHFKPVDWCEHGISTVDHCMEVGMDDDGYDCSGLVVASICDALGLNTANWNRDYRHLRQIEQLAQEDIVPDIGDILVFYPENDKDKWTHMGIMATESSTIHADGINKEVVESPTKEISTNYKVVPLQVLIEYGS